MARQRNGDVTMNRYASSDTARHGRARGDRSSRRAGGGAGQGQGRRLPGELDAALFRGGRARLLQGAEHRDRDGAADRRSAQRRRDDHQPDRRRRGAGDDRGHERQHQEARRRHVHLGQQPEQDLPDGAVRRPQGGRSQDHRSGPQGQEDHVRARPGQRHHGQGRARRGRPQGRRLHASISSTWASTST